MKGGAFMNPYADLSKKNLDFINKIRHFSSRQADLRPKFRKIRESPFNFLCRSFSAIMA